MRPVEPGPRSGPRRRLLAGVALGLGLAAALVGEGHSGAGVRWELASEPAATLGPVELAARLRADPGGLRIVDLRAREAREAWRIPRAEPPPQGGLAELPRRPDVLTVVYDERGTAGAAAAALRAVGHRDVRELEGGARAWIRQVMEPVLPMGADSATRAAFDRVAELSRYFGGSPREAGPDDPQRPEWALAQDSGEPPPAAAEGGRRGCGW